VRPAVFLDRDGVIIENRDDYVRSWEDVTMLPAAGDALRRLGRSDYALVMVTNQSAIGRGILTRQEADRINTKLVESIVADGGRLDASYLCPHSPDDDCACRKPAPGLLLRAADELDLDRARSFMIGDAACDMEAALAAGVRGIFVLTGRGSTQLDKLSERHRASCVIVDDLGAAVDHILGQWENRS
jgi:histidinol-phosphate phosphatase family protein